MRPFFFTNAEKPRRIFSLELTGKVPIKKIKIEPEAETPDLFLNTIEKIIDTFKEEKDTDLVMKKRLRSTSQVPNVFAKTKSRTQNAEIQ